MSKLKINRISETLSSFIVDTNLDVIPQEVINVSKMAIIDTIGVTLGASCIEPISSILTEFIREIGGRPEARVIGKALKCDAPSAALANGTLAHYLDYDDILFPMRGHPSAPVLPGILALGEKKKSSGKEVLESYVIGLEIMAKLGAEIALEHSEKGWHSTGTLGTIGATAASAKILKLDTEKTMMALGIAASKASGLRENFGTTAKPLHAGNSAKNGVEAALLAEKGLTASKDIWEGHFGFLNLFVGEGRYNVHKVTEGLGKSFSIVYSGIVLKRYPSCSSTHVAIEGILKLIDTYNFVPENIKSVEIGVNYRVPQDLVHHNPKTGLQGKFSMEFCMANALLEKKVVLDQFQDARVEDQQVQELMKRVRMYVPEELRNRDIVDTGYTDVTVELYDGKKHSLRLDNSSIKGFPNNPFTMEELYQKYQDCAVHSALTEEQINQSIELLGNLDQVKDITEVMDTIGEKV